MRFEEITLMIIPTNSFVYVDESIRTHSVALLKAHHMVNVIALVGNVGPKIEVSFFMKLSYQ